MKPIISTIIPVYNKVGYLDACIESVINQTVQQLEIILVDDGSTDQSGYLCDEWAEKDPRIRVIHKQNAGAGLARNTGLEIAEGQFVSFVDADDYIDLDTYRICLEELRKEDADICYFGRCTLANGSIQNNILKIDAKQIYEKEHIQKEFINNFLGSLPNENPRRYIRESICCSLYSKELITESKVTFYSEKDFFNEDGLFNLDICRYAKKIIVLPNIFYYNNICSDSNSRKYVPDKFERSKTFYNKTKEYIIKYPENIQVQARIDYKLLIQTAWCIQLEVRFRKRYGWLATYQHIRVICKDKLVQEVLRRNTKVSFKSKKDILWNLIRFKFVCLILLYYMNKEIPRL